MNITKNARVLVIEDDRKISELLQDYLRADGFDVSAVFDGSLAVREIESNPPTVIILDLLLPGKDGLSICKAVRAFSDVPIMMLTARVDEIDRLLGLDIGADDYVCKPFSPREVVARVRAMVRRSTGKVTAAPLPWAVDDDAFRIKWRGHLLPLTRIEFFMVRLLFSRPGRVFSREQLLSSVYEDQRDISDRAIDTHIKNIRKKIQSVDSGFEAIVSVYGLGYRFEQPD
jgi:two-component system response regulator BaeR